MPNPQSAIFEDLKTTKLEWWDFHYATIESLSQQYIAYCKLCHWIVALCHTLYGQDIQQSPALRPSKLPALHFISDPQQLLSSWRPRIFVTSDCVTEFMTYLPFRRDIDLSEMVQISFKYMICKHGVTGNITTDWSHKFTSLFWDRRCFHLSINCQLMSPLHRQAQGQTKWQNEAK